MLYRQVAVVFVQHVGDEWTGPIPATNNLVLAGPYGSTLPAYDGFERLGVRQFAKRDMYATNVLSPTVVEPLPQQSTDFSRARVAPSYWWQPQTFDLSPDPVITFLAAWATKANMGSGFNVQ